MPKNKSQAGEFPGTPHLLLLLLLFTGSGCSALIYETVWYQLLQFSIGSTTVPLGILLATFMGGLCLGSLALPRVRVLLGHHPLLVYALIEFAIALCGIGVLYEVPWLSRIHVPPVGHGLAAILLSSVGFGRVFIATDGADGCVTASGCEVAVADAARDLMGWPAVWWEHGGAVCGCLLAGFWLLRIFDMRTATLFAASINAMVGLISLGLVVLTPARDTTAGAVYRRSRTGTGAWRIYIAIALSGASALGAEVIWTRLLGLMMGATVYTFSIILAVFLVSLAAGSGVGSLLARMEEPQRTLGTCQFLLTAAIAWGCVYAGKVAARLADRSKAFWAVVDFSGGFGARTLGYVACGTSLGSQLSACACLGRFLGGRLSRDLRRESMRPTPAGAILGADRSAWC